MRKSNNSISFITTVFNEEKTIDGLLASLKKQAMLPGEVIITDAGSTDKTREKIEQFQKSASFPIKVFLQKGNRSVGRNEAIEQAEGNIIVVSDAGCTLDKNWVKNITEAFHDPQVDVVAGFYEPVTKTVFQKCLATYTSVMPDRVNPENFLPSSRSVAFRKTVWTEMGGYPEYLDTCEDLVFARKMKQAGYRFVFAGKAIVYWPQRENIIEAARQFFSYAKGDGIAHYFRPQTPLLFFRYLSGGILLWLYMVTKSQSLLLLIMTLFVGYLFLVNSEKLSLCSTRESIILPTALAGCCRYFSFVWNYIGIDA